MVRMALVSTDIDGWHQCSQCSSRPCSFARRAMIENDGHDQQETGQRWQASPMPCFNKQDGVMPYLLKSRRSPAGPRHGIRIARATVVAKPKIEQLLANRSGAGPWPGRCSGYGWLLLCYGRNPGCSHTDIASKTSIAVFLLCPIPTS